MSFLPANFTSPSLFVIVVVWFCCSEIQSPVAQAGLGLMSLLLWSPSAGITGGDIRLDFSVRFEEGDLRVPTMVDQE